MRDLIKNILRESSHISPNAPHWVEEFQTMSTKDRITQIEKNKKDIEKILPRIVEFFKDKFGKYLLKFEIEEKGLHYGNENYTSKTINLIFYLSELTPDVNGAKREIFNDLNSFFAVGDSGCYRAAEGSCRSDPQAYQDELTLFKNWIQQSSRSQLNVCLPHLSGQTEESQVS